MAGARNLGGCAARAAGLDYRPMARILVADDDAAFLGMLTDRLQSRGHQVIPVSDGMQVAEKAQELHPDLLVLDIQMPNSYGTTAHSVLRDRPRTADLPVIFVTGVPLENAKKIVPDLPNVRLVGKPVDFAGLLALVEELLK